MYVVDMGMAMLKTQCLSSVPPLHLLPGEVQRDGKAFGTLTVCAENVYPPTLVTAYLASLERLPLPG